MLTFAILLQTTLLVLRTHSRCNSPFLVASGMFGFSRLDLIVGNVNKSESWKHMGKGGFHSPHALNVRQRTVRRE